MCIEKCLCSKHIFYSVCSWVFDKHLKVFNLSDLENPTYHTLISTSLHKVFNFFTLSHFQNAFFFKNGEWYFANDESHNNLNLLKP